MNPSTPQPKCLDCNRFIPLWESHGRCHAHWSRNCDQANPCKHCSHWSSSVWDKLAVAIQASLDRAQRHIKSTKSKKHTADQPFLSTSFVKGLPQNSAQLFTDLNSKIDKLRQYNAKNRSKLSKAKPKAKKTTNYVRSNHSMSISLCSLHSQDVLMAAADQSYISIQWLCPAA